MAASLEIPPRDFTRAVYKIRSTPSGSLPTEIDLFQTISRGMHGTPMSPWRRLSENERWALVFHLKSLSPRFRSERPERPFVAPSIPITPEALLPRGRALYRLFQCTACHGDEGKGDGPGAERYRGEVGRTVRIRHLDRDRFIRGDELQDVFLTLRTGLDGTPMGAYDALSEEDLWALAVFVRDGLRRPPAAEPPPRASEPGDLP